MNPLVGLLSITLALLMLWIGVGSFVSLGQALWGDSIGRARGRMETHWWADVRLGALHGVGLLVLAIVSRNHPLLGLLTLALIGFALTCLWMAIPALVQRLGERIVPGRSRLQGNFVGAFCLVWGCAIPYLGQALLLVLLLGTYATGLAGFLNRKSPVSVATASLDEYESLVSGIPQVESKARQGRE